MKPTKIEFSFDDAKLEAIKLFLKEKDVSLDEELDHCMDALYKKYVPQPVRDFIEKKEAEAAQAAAPAKKTGARRNPTLVPLPARLLRMEQQPALARKAPCKPTCGLVWPNLRTLGR